MDNTPALQDNFNQQNHLDKFILHANPETVDQIENVKKRTEEIHEKLKEHHARHWMIWTKKEQDRFLNANSAAQNRNITMEAEA